MTETYSYVVILRLTCDGYVVTAFADPFSPDAQAALQSLESELKKYCRTLRKSLREYSFIYECKDAEQVKLLITSLLGSEVLFRIKKNC